MSTWNSALKRVFSQPAFLVAVIVLGVSAAGLNGAATFLKLHFKKRPVPLAVASLKQGIPETLGPWVQVSRDQPMDSEMEQVLGTSEYVFRDYADTRLISKDDVNALKNSSAADRDALLGKLQMEKPAAFIRVGITYYTGMADTVAHVPERCYVADGFEVSEYDTKKAALGTFANGTPRNVEYRFLTFEDQTGRSRVSRNVGYIFHCDGRYDCSPVEVRRHLQDLLEPYGYYAKVELMTTAPPAYRPGMDLNNREDSVRAMSDFLAAALPAFERCLPDWEAIHRSGGNVSKAVAAR